MSTRTYKGLRRIVNDLDLYYTKNGLRTRKSRNPNTIIVRLRQRFGNRWITMRHKSMWHHKHKTYGKNTEYTQI